MCHSRTLLLLATAAATCIPMALHPPSAGAQAPYETGQQIVLRYTPEKGARILEGGEVTETFTPGELHLNQFAPGALAAESAEQNARIEAKRESEKQMRASEEEAAMAQAEETARRNKSEEAEAKERAAIAENAVRMLNGRTGRYEKVIPVSQLKPKETGRERRAREKEAAQSQSEVASTLEKKSIRMLDGRTGRYVEVVPVDEVVDTPRR